MTRDEAREAVIRELLVKAEQALAAARRERDAGDLALAINRVYYASFYALSAVLLRQGLTFGRHVSVRIALHQHLVRPGLIPADFGGFYDAAFEERQAADYGTFARFEPSAVDARIEKAGRFVAEMRRLLEGKP